MKWAVFKSKWAGVVGGLLDVVGIPGVIGDGTMWWGWFETVFSYGIAWFMVGVGTLLLFAYITDKLTIGGTLAPSMWLLVPRRPPLNGFDTPILTAINHLLDSPHSYTRSDRAERQALTMLYQEMCSGRLPVIGAKHDFAAPRRISAWECRRLDLREVGVTPSPAAPDGVRFVLATPGRDEASSRACPVFGSEAAICSGSGQDEDINTGI